MILIVFLLLWFDLICFARMVLTVNWFALLWKNILVTLIWFWERLFTRKIWFENILVIENFIWFALKYCFYNSDLFMVWSLQFDLIWKNVLVTLNWFDWENVYLTGQFDLVWFENKLLVEDLIWFALKYCFDESDLIWFALT